MISLITNTRGMTQMPLTKPLAEMSGPELVAEFNRLANARGLNRVTRFKDRETGIRRVQAMALQVGSGVAMPSTRKPQPTVDELCEAFEVRKGTNREKLLVAMAKSFERQALTVEALALSVYGTADQTAALLMVMKGLQTTIDKKKLPYQIIREKDSTTKEVTYGLHFA